MDTRLRVAKSAEDYNPLSHKNQKILKSAAFNKLPRFMEFLQGPYSGSTTPPEQKGTFLYLCKVLVRPGFSLASSHLLYTRTTHTRVPDCGRLFPHLQHTVTLKVGQDSQHARETT